MSDVDIHIKYENLLHIAYNLVSLIEADSKHKMKRRKYDEVISIFKKQVYEAIDNYNGTQHSPISGSS